MTEQPVAVPVRVTLREKQRRRRIRRALAYTGVAVAWALSILVSTVVSLPEPAHTAVLFVHLGSLIVGFGAVLMIDWHALLWATEWSSVRELRQADRTLVLPVWIGLAGLLTSGALLEPDLESPMTQVKLAAVLVLSLNGVALTRWTFELARLPARARFRSLSPRVRTGFIASAVVSQIAWWLAVLIGMLNSTS